MDAAQFAAKWARNTRPERAASQSHFNDLCEILALPTPNEADPDGEWYAFEKGAKKLGGDDGFADVWKRGCFAWEYKGKKKDLAAAYEQLNRYREDFERSDRLPCRARGPAALATWTKPPGIPKWVGLRDRGLSGSCARGMGD